MYADNTLTPKEATRLCALGILADGPVAYAELASGVRHFVTHVMGPSLGVLGTSIELLKHEGLVTPISGDKDKAVLKITDEGLSELKTLLTAKIKTAENDLNKLVIALKFRFMTCWMRMSVCCSWICCLTRLKVNWRALKTCARIMQTILST